ncbi:MAG: ATP-dependent helicase, partial [Candidatus Paceibacterota bacterium]
IVLNAPKFKKKLKSVRYTIIDEIHSLCSNKRGVHLSLSLERLQEMAKEKFTRIGLSATQAPIEEIAKFLVGYEDPEQEKSRGCKIAQVDESKGMDLKVLSPVKDLIHTPPYEVNDETYAYLHDLIQQHETTLVFTNTRAGTERVVHNLKKRFPDSYNQDNIGAHHGSMGKEKRLEVEEDLKQGNLKTVVSSTSLELGIDIGYIDLVLQMGSPKGIARAIQRIGRSGHQLRETAKGRILIADRDDNLECSVMAKCAREENLDKIKIPQNCLDVLAQHVVGMGCHKKWDIDEAYDLVRSSYNYVNLNREDYGKTLKYVAGDYASLEDQHVYGKIWLDEEENRFGRRGKLTRVIYMTNIGTIPDESNYKVYTRQKKNFVGTLDEEFLDRLTKKDVFVLGGSTYEFNYSKGMKVYVTPRPNASPTVPAWYSEMLPLSYDLGVEIGNFNDQVKEMLKQGKSDQEIKDWILDEFYLNDKAADALFSYLKEQHQYSTIPGNKEILIEKTTDEEQNQLIVFHTIFGRRVNDALARVFADVLTEQVGENVGIVVDDHGFVLKTSLDSIDPVKSEFRDDRTELVPAHNFDEVDVEALVEKVAGSDIKQILKETVRKTELMKRRFRHVAARALMILRNYKGQKKSVGKQQMKSHFLLNAAEKIDPDFPIIKETYREIMEDVMDLEHAQEVMKKIRSGEAEITIAKNKTPSPFAHNLVLQGRSDLVLMGDKKERLQRLHRKVLQKIDS